MKIQILLLAFFLSAVSFSQGDSLMPPLIDLTIVVKMQDTGEPVNGITLKITGSDGSQQIFTTDIYGTKRFVSDENTGFLKSGNTYKIETVGAGLKFFRIEDTFSTVGINQNTRLVREFGLSYRYTVRQPKSLPSLKIKGLLTEIDSQAEDSLSYIYALMVEHPSMVISITSLFEHEMDITPFWRRSKTICARLVEMGIPQERLVIKIEKYSEQRDQVIQNRKAGNVVFAIESFDYVPKE